MDLRRALNDFVSKCKFLGTRLESNEQDRVTEIDLLMLRAQLFLLDTAAANLQELKRLQRKSSTIEPAEQWPMWPDAA